MRFDWRMLALLLVGCGPGLNGFSLGSGPVQTVKARVDVDGIRASGYSGALLVGVGWVDADTSSRLCSEFSSVPELAAACADPFAPKFRHDTVLVALELDDEGLVELPIMRLPPADAAVGDSRGRVTYGSVLVVADSDGNGLFEPHGNSLGEQEPILAASFSSLLVEQQRIVFREGAWNGLSFFFPALGCEAPPTGFSRMVATLSLENGTPKGECEITGLDEPLELRPLSADEHRSMMCRTVFASISPEHMAPPIEGGGVCLDEERYFMPSVDGLCTTGMVASLAGCWDNPLCEEPEWNFRGNPPDWWSCR